MARTTKDGNPPGHVRTRVNRNRYTSGKKPRVRVEDEPPRKKSTAQLHPQAQARADRESIAEWRRLREGRDHDRDMAKSPQERNSRRTKKAARQVKGYLSLPKAKAKTAPKRPRRPLSPKNRQGGRSRR